MEPIQVIQKDHQRPEAGGQPAEFPQFFLVELIPGSGRLKILHSGLHQCHRM